MTPTDMPLWLTPKKKRRWLLPSILAAAVLAGSVGTWLVLRSGDSDSPADRLTTVSQTCADLRYYGGEIGDGGRTLVVATKPPGLDEYARHSQERLDGLDCILTKLEVPDSVRAHLNQTRALDGRQTDKWGNYEASWTYHPDDGLNLVITVAESS